jgi:hypothetical protein
MDVITKEVERALDNGLYYLAVMLALTLPDICAALESRDGQTSGSRYKAWYTSWLASRYSTLTGNDLYRLRCGVVHQGRFGPSSMQYSRILFTIPNPQGNVFHNNIINDALNLDTQTFCQDMLACVKRWYASKENDPNVIQNLPHLVQFREYGLAPYMVGMPLIA